jgi:catechol 2,3-dioxygenase-like lactoylglutathione lyase family enzyme
MLKDARIHTTLPAADLARARAWYAEKLGLTPVDEQPAGLFYECAGGTRFLLFPSSGRPSGSHTQIGFSVADIVAEVRDLRARGVVFEEYDFPGLKTVDGIADTGPVRSAWFKDSEGNLAGIVQLPAGAP